MTRDIGFIGLGQMGGAMALRLLDAGYRLHVIEPVAETRAPFEARGATVYESPTTLADAVEIVVACLPKAKISLAVAADVAKGSRIRTYVETSTIGRTAMLEIASILDSKGIALVDCPISGGPTGAAAGTLVAMMSGKPEALAAAGPVVEGFAGKVFVVGDEPGLAQIMKVVNNLISAANMATAFEAFVIGAKAGIDADMMVKIINVSTGRNSATETKLPKAVLPGTFDFGARLDTMYKDITLGLAEAETLGVPTWTLGAMAQMWRFCMSQVGGEKDFTRLIQPIEQWAGAEVRSRSAKADGSGT